MTSHAGIFLACLAALTAASASARAEQEIPRELRGIEIEDRLGAALPLHTAVVDERGAAVTIGEYFKAKRPVILVLNYYSCPTLCSLVLNKLVDGLKGLDFTVGREFEVVALSIDPNEKPPLASSKRAAYLTSLDRPVTPTGWPFLTATADAIASVASAVGFRFRYDAETKQYAHAAGIFVLTPDGRLSRTLYGLMYPTRDLRLALIEAGKGSIGSPIDRLLMFCYHYDPENRRYLISPMTVMRIGGSLAAVFLAMFLLSAWRKERRASVSG